MKNNMQIKKPWLLVAAIAISQSAGIVGSIFTVDSIDTWYQFLNKPFFSPPNWVFGPMWILLYTLIGIVLYKLWTSKSGDEKYRKKTVKLFWTHLVLNALWSPVFFGLQNPKLALVIIVAMLVLIIVLMKRFWKISKVSTYLFIPYVLWVSFATMLNMAIVVLNK